MKTEISEIKEKHKDILQKHLDEIKQIQSLIKQTLLAIKEIKNSTELAPTIKYSSKIREFSKLPPKVKSENYWMNQSLLPQYRLDIIDYEVLPILMMTVYGLVDGPMKSNASMLMVSLQQKIVTQSGQMPSDIAVNVGRDVLYSDRTVGTVNKVKNGQIEELIRLQGWVPGNLCVTSTGDLLVTLYSIDQTQSKVVRYLGSTEKQTIQFDEEGKPLYSGNFYTKYITENRNHDICVADRKAGAVVVVNQDGKLRWRYTGHPSVTKNKPFKPRGITTDSQSRVLTADENNHCIHILDQNGQFLRDIDNCDLESPFGLCVDNNDNLYGCEYYKGNVKKIKYVK
uniref:Tripartite motif-containing protein 3 n=1 Tax=Magallana gigas TaxID=29159 RepID=K1PNV8_MAGGI